MLTSNGVLLIGGSESTVRPSAVISDHNVHHVPHVVGND